MHKPFKLLSFGSFLLVLCIDVVIGQPGYGAVRFNRFGSTSHLYSSGILQVFYQDYWGNVCFSNQWGTDEADVVCRQLGWSGASSTLPSSSVASTTSYGIDYLYSIITSVDCVNNSIPVLLQCTVSTTPTINCGDDNDVTVACYSTRLWESIGYPGMLRLVGGSYITEGRVEVYCNGQWGTVCDDGVSWVEANTMCKHLGYSRATKYDHLRLPGNATQPIWLDDVHCGIESRNCITTCQQCPASGRNQHDCVHGEDLTIACTYLDNIGGSTFDTCSTTTVNDSLNDDSDNTVIIGVLVGIGVLAIFIFAAVGFICGIIFCGRNHGKGNTDQDEDDKRSATPTMGSLSPEVIQMESSPKMYRKNFEPHFVMTSTQPQSNGTKSGHHNNHKHAAYNPTYNDYVDSSGNDRQFPTTPPAYLGHPATSRFY